MDRITKIIGSRIKASSLIEVITALVIISIIFTVAIIVYLNVQRSGFSSQKVTGDVLINEVLVKALQTKKFTSSEEDMNGIIVYMDVSQHPSISRLTILTLEARNPNGKLITQRKKLVYVSGQP